ncbi:MAG TPA: helix-turn-helix transcriptional regulator [Pseudonocardiaceae bacterium]
MATIHSRELARRLRRAQTVAGLDGITLARALELSETKLSRIMNGVVVPSLAEAAAVMALCGVAGQARDRVLDLCHPRHDRGILRLSNDTQWEALGFHAAEASRVIEYQPMLIPWLAQTESYSRAWFAPPMEKAGQLVTASMDTPSPAARSALRELLAAMNDVELIIHERALRAPVGDVATQLTQLRHLRRVSGLRTVSLWTVPDGRALPVRALSGFMILDFKDKPSLVFREDPTGGVFFDDPGEVTLHRRIVEHLGQIASDVRDSRKLIEHIIDECDPGSDPIKP